jgi:siroheme synthase-like protein
MFLPLGFKSNGMRCLIIGGGEVAWRKLELLAAGDCAVTVIAPQIHEGIRCKADLKLVCWVEREFCSGDCRGSQLVIAATGQRDVNRAVFEEAKALGLPVNVVDDPELSTVIFPAVWRQGSLAISVSTEGVAPFMAAAIRDRLAVHGDPLAAWVEAASKFRAMVRSEINNRSERDLLYGRFVDAMKTGYPPDPPESGKLGDWIVWLERTGRKVR